MREGFCAGDKIGKALAWLAQLEAGDGFAQCFDECTDCIIIVQRQIAKIECAE